MPLGEDSEEKIVSETDSVADTDEFLSASEVLLFEFSKQNTAIIMPAITRTADSTDTKIMIFFFS